MALRYIIIHVWPKGLGDPTVMPDIYKTEAEAIKVAKALRSIDKRSQLGEQKYTVAALTL